MVMKKKKKKTSTIKLLPKSLTSMMTLVPTPGEANAYRLQCHNQYRIMNAINYLAARSPSQTPASLLALGSRILTPIVAEDDTLYLANLKDNYYINLPHEYFA